MAFSECLQHVCFVTSHLCRNGERICLLMGSLYGKYVGRTVVRLYDYHLWYTLIRLLLTPTLYSPTVSQLSLYYGYYKTDSYVVAARIPKSWYITKKLFKRLIMPGIKLEAYVISGFHLPGQDRYTIKAVVDLQ